ncbi:uncharacterized protein LOC117645657 [Thrips palmi]|uniref:Uncharacterized protein LOC117645657 n=1 Tax=Thrips palmi TaxID=161013 RepID=A0A6P8YWE5_THRPL|nr:uncharacterized protein LOC117645657 [Thrips palmi]
MLAARVKSYYAAAGGDGAGKKVKEVVPPSARTSRTSRTACGRLALSSSCAPLLASLKKTHSCGASLHVPLPTHAVLAVEGPAALSKRPKKSRSVGDLANYAKHFTKCRAGVPAPMDRGGEGGVRDSTPGPWAVQPAALAHGTASTGTCGALRACQLLMLNAWRMRREETRVLRTRVDQMRLQITTLRSLNKQEGERAVRAHQDSGRARLQCDGLRQQLEALRTESESLAAANAALEGRIAEQMTTAENLRNELQAAKQDAAALDAQLAKERAKLAAARQQCGDLNEQVAGTEALLKEAGVQLEAARCDCER